MSYKPKKYYIKTFGCQANVADSNSMSGILDVLGFEQILPKKSYKNESEEFLDILPKADIFIVNTCSVRQKSEDKVYGLGKIIKQLRETYKKVPFCIMSGCMVGSVTGERQRYEFDVLKKKTPWVDMYMNPSQVFELPDLLKSEGVLDGWASAAFTASEIVPKQQEKTHAYINISYGCDNFCTFCVVPYARGKEISRSEKEILQEIKHLIARGFSEFTLCGQNVNSWGLDVSQKFDIRAGSERYIPFASLLKQIHELEGVAKIEFISSNPFDFGQEMIDVLKLPKISNYLHIAVQSGNNEVLKKMNRRHTIEDFYDLIARIKNLRPDIELGTDIIVGFPGETEEQFLDTVKIFKNIKFNVAFISMYSPRRGTPAEKFYKDDISRKEKKRRHDALTRVWKDSLL